jgi:uncharacterized protein
MNILVSGSSGFLGSSLVPSLQDDGHQVIRLIRQRPESGSRDLYWEPASESIPDFPSEGIDAVVHLAGENIASGRWTAERKAKIRDSRVKGTQLLCQSLVRMRRPPAAVLSASALGYYGDRGDELLTEDSPPGLGFLAELCRAWEEAMLPAAERSIRVVILRTALVLAAGGGMLARLLPVFKAGVGGTMGGGGHYLSWVALADYIGIVRHCIGRPDLAGPVIVAAPGPVTNREFANVLGRILSRPAVLRMPAIVARLLFGELADEALLASQRAEPVRVKSSGYRFLFPELEPALRQLVVS